MKKIIKRIFKIFNIQLMGKTQLERNDAFYHLKKLLDENRQQVIFDVGAATGDFAAEMKAIFKNSSIHAFEPQESSFSHIQQHYSAVCKPYKIAFSDSEGRQNFFITTNGVSSSLLKPSITNTGLDQLTRVDDSITVETDTIDNFCRINNIDHINLLKLDIQGAELKALKGASGLLEKKMIDVIYTEVEFMSLYENQPLFHDIAAYLNGHGYKLYNIYNTVYIKHAVICWADAIFIKNDLYEASVA